MCADGTVAAERFFGQQPRSIFAAILESVELSLLLSVSRDELCAKPEGRMVADAIIEAIRSDAGRHNNAN
jgi:hypothetical protein